jgi:hypothetical protein
MAEVECICNYCGFSWKDPHYYAFNKVTCLKCRDKNVKIKPIEKSKKNIYYQEEALEDAYIKDEEDYE